MKNLTLITLTLFSTAFSAQADDLQLPPKDAVVIEQTLRNDLYLPTFYCPRTRKYAHSQSVSGEWSVVDASIRMSSELSFSMKQKKLAFTREQDRYEIQGFESENSDGDMLSVEIFKNGQRIGFFEDRMTGDLDVIYALHYIVDAEPTQVTDTSLAAQCAGLYGF